MPFSEICLIVSLIFAIIYAWPIWAPPYEPWRDRSFAISWVFFVVWLFLGHGGVNMHG